MNRPTNPPEKRSQNRIVHPILSIFFLFLTLIAAGFMPAGQNRDPLKTELITSDIDHFWAAFDQAQPGLDPAVFQRLYLDKGSKGIKGFTRNRIQDADHLAAVVRSHARYYASIRESTKKIALMKDSIRKSMIRLKEIYPDAVFPPIYFVIGALNSGGTTSKNGLIIGAEMYGLTPETPMEELGDWLRTVIKPVDQIPYIVAHEVVHFQQKYDGSNLLSACIKEGSADFIAELISGKHINQHVHDFADPREKELWLEFKSRMSGKDFQGWLYSSQAGRPNDLGYWMGYKIVKAYYDKAADKKKAIDEILHIRDFNQFLAASGYADRF